MGNDNSNDDERNFNVEPYLKKKPGLTQRDVFEIRRVFQIYKPVNGKIKSKDVVKKMGDVPEMVELKE